MESSGRNTAFGFSLLFPFVIKYSLMFHVMYCRNCCHKSAK